VLTSFVLYFSALLLVYQRNEKDVASVAGLALSNALQMLVFVQWTVRQWGEVETQMSSVGQLAYYGNIKPEAPFEIPEHKPPAEWPQKGLIKFRKVELKYQKFGVSVLKDINLDIYPGEKIGIVGRTGSGKSTVRVKLM
jgi:ABC-type multidrug transport system fused ATPase/permease subunit